MLGKTAKESEVVAEKSILDSYQAFVYAADQFKLFFPALSEKEPFHIPSLCGDRLQHTKKEFRADPNLKDHLSVRDMEEVRDNPNLRKPALGVLYVDKKTGQYKINLPIKRPQITPNFDYVKKQHHKGYPQRIMRAFGKPDAEQLTVGIYCYKLDESSSYQVIVKHACGGFDEPDLTKINYPFNIQPLEEDPHADSENIYQSTRIDPHFYQLISSECKNCVMDRIVEGEMSIELVTKGNSEELDRDGILSHLTGTNVFDDVDIECVRGNSRPRTAGVAEKVEVKQFDDLPIWGRLCEQEKKCLQAALGDKKIDSHDALPIILPIIQMYTVRALLARSRYTPEELEKFSNDQLLSLHKEIDDFIRRFSVNGENSVMFAPHQIHEHCDAITPLFSTDFPPTLAFQFDAEQQHFFVTSVAPMKLRAPNCRPDLCLAKKMVNPEGKSRFINREIHMRVDFPAKGEEENGALPPVKGQLLPETDPLLEGLYHNKIRHNGKEVCLSEQVEKALEDPYSEGAAFDATLSTFCSISIEVASGYHHYAPLLNVNMVKMQSLDPFMQVQVRQGNRYAPHIEELLDNSENKLRIFRQIQRAHNQDEINTQLDKFSFFGTLCKNEQDMLVRAVFAAKQADNLSLSKIMSLYMLSAFILREKYSDQEIAEMSDKNLMERHQTNLHRIYMQQDAILSNLKSQKEFDHINRALAVGGVEKYPVGSPIRKYIEKAKVIQSKLFFPTERSNDIGWLLNEFNGENKSEQVSEESDIGQLQTIELSTTKLPDYKTKLGKNVIAESRYARSLLTDRILLPLVGKQAGEKWQQQTPKTGFDILAVDIEKGLITLNGKNFGENPVTSRPTLSLLMLLAFKLGDQKLAGMTEEVLRSGVTAVVNECSVTDESGERFGFIENGKPALIERAVAAALEEKEKPDCSSDKIKKVIYDILLEGFTKDLIQQTTGAPASALDSLAVHYHRESLAKQPLDMLEKRVLSKTGSSPIVSADSKKSQFDVAFVDGKELSYFDLKSTVFYTCKDGEDELPIQDPIVSRFKLVPEENVPSTRVVLVNSQCPNPNGVAASLYQGNFDYWLTEDAPHPELKQKIENEKSLAEFDKAADLYRDTLANFKKVALDQVENYISDEARKRRYTKFIEQRVAAHNAVLSEMYTVLHAQRDNDVELAKILPVFTNTLHMEAGMLVAATRDIDCKRAKDLFDDTDIEVLNKALEDSPQTLAKLAKIPTANKVLGAVLATIGLALASAALVGLIGVTIVATFGLAAIPILSACVLGAMGIVGAAGLGAASDNLLSKPTKGVSVGMHAQVCDANKGLKKEAHKLQDLVPKPSFWDEASCTISNAVSFFRDAESSFKASYGNPWEKIVNDAIGNSSTPAT